MNAVYFYFDPEDSSRSLGTFNILHLINLCRELNIENLYLGYWIGDVKEMNYKASFSPHYLLKEHTWQQVCGTGKP